MMNRNIVSEFKKGREKNFFVRVHEGTYYLEKITKACAFTIIAGSEKTVMNYIDNNGFKFVGLIVK